MSKLILLTLPQNMNMRFFDYLEPSKMLLDTLDKKAEEEEAICIAKTLLLCIKHPTFVLDHYISLKDYFELSTFLLSFPRKRLEQILSAYTKVEKENDEIKILELIPENFCYQRFIVKLPESISLDEFKKKSTPFSRTFGRHELEIFYKNLIVQAIEENNGECFDIFHPNFIEEDGTTLKDEYFELFFSIHSFYVPTTINISKHINHVKSLFTESTDENGNFIFTLRPEVIH